MRRFNLPSLQHPPRRSGFTLTEMLVATGLVVLIMLMFAQIYAVAIGTLREQRGLAQNDQKARIVTNMLRNDLQNMTYRQPAFPYGNVQGIVALSAGDEPIVDPVNQQGYFAFSENGTANDGDDVLQFTVRVGAGQRGDVETRGGQRPYQGKARSLGGAFANQPSNDNGSTAAEVSYFLRHGVLYRRVLLLRDPLKRRPKADSQPSNPNTGERRFESSGTPDYSGDFYRDFDFSATRNGGVLWFHSVESLDNSAGTNNLPIANPAFRFGHSRGNGSPTEFDSVGNFLGRFTIQETSHSAFDWPGTNPANNPYTRGDLTDTNEDGVVDQFAGTDRVGEDILLTNVEAFDIKVLDEPADTDDNGSEGPGGFVDIGHSFGQGIYHNSRNNNSTYAANAFDSWHPSVGHGSGDPPYQSFEQTGLVNWSTSATNDIRVPVLGNNSMRYTQITSGSNGSIRPEFPPVPGTIVQDGTSRWQCVDNRVGLKAIQITIRFRDPTSNIPRQLTLVHSFVE